MNLIGDWTSRFAWPNVATEWGIGRACSIGAAALLWIALTYIIALVDALSGSDLLGNGANEGVVGALALSSLCGGVAATIYLAVRIKLQHCPLAAWVSFLWIGYGAINTLLGIAPNSPAIFLILTFASFQGVRGCTTYREAST